MVKGSMKGMMELVSKVKMSNGIINEGIGRKIWGRKMMI